MQLVSRVLRWFDRPSRLLLLGVGAAALGTFELARVHPAPWTMLSTRSQGLQWTLGVLDRGGPILTASPPGSSELFPAGGGDDQGLYLIVPWLAHTLGWEDPVNLLRWIALLAFAIPLLLYPWLIRELTGSTLAAILSPLPLVIGLWLLPLADIYWVAAWAILALLPVLMLLDRRWPRGGLAILLGLLVLASLASAIRGQAGLPVLIAAFLVVARRPWRSWWRLGAAALCIVAYLSVSTFGLAAARAERDRQLDGRALSGDYGDGHPFWHTAYIGLGYLPNDWDIRYYDGVAYRDVLREDPKARFLGPAYGRILRDRYFELIGDDPGYAVKNYAAKLLVALRPATPILVVLAIVGPWLVLRDPRRRRWRRDALFFVPTAVIAVASPLLATPDSSYLLGWLAAVLLAGILAGTAVLSALTPVRLAHAARLPGELLRRLGRRAVLASTVAVVVLLAIGVVAAPSILDTARSWQNEIAPPQVSQPADATH